MLKVVGYFFRSSWKQIFIISIFSTVAAGLNVLSIKFVRDIVTEGDTNKFVNLGYVALLVLSAGAITLLIEKYSTSYFEKKLAAFREELAERLLMARYEKINSKLDRLAPVLLFEINEVSDFGKLIPAFVVAVVQIIAIMTYLIILSWQLSLIVLTLFLTVIALMFFTLPMVKKMKDKRSKTRYRLHVMFLLMSQGFKDLLMSRKHGSSYISNSIRPPSLETARHNTNIQMLSVAVEQSINALLILGFGVSMILYLEWIQASQELAVQFIALLLFILPSFIKVIGFFNEIKDAENALDQINELDADISKSMVVPTEELTYIPQKGEPIITLKGFQYAYNESEHGFKLGPVDLQLFDNQITVINGGNGSGKTTIFNLIAGLYESNGGEMFFQDKKITNDNIRSYRDLFCTYFTDSPVFDSLDHVSKENMEKGERYIKLLELEGKTTISTTTIAQTNLSFGQRGRLNLLRLLLEDRPIYMLDEWAANQDLHFKEKFYEEIIPELKKLGKTVILITHDDRFYHIADRVVTMRNGMIDSIKDLSKVL